MPDLIVLQANGQVDWQATRAAILTDYDERVRRGEMSASEYVMACGDIDNKIVRLKAIVNAAGRQRARRRA